MHPTHTLASRKTLSSQAGMTTLFVSLLTLVISTIAIITTAQVVVFEQRSTSNTLREHQALGAATTGFEHALAYVQNGGPDQDGDGIADTIVSPGSPADAPNGGTYAVELCNPTSTLPANPTSNCTTASDAANGFETILIYARGWSDDMTGIRHVVGAITKSPGLASPPADPLTTKGVASINGSGSVTNPEGKTTIWSGQTVTFTNANFHTSALVDDSTTPQELSDRDSTGPDVRENDGNLSSLSDDAFFENFFGSSPTAYQTNSATHVFAPANIGNYGTANVTGNAVLWSTGDTSTSGNTTYGSTSRPVILIIDGDLDAAGTIEVNGMLYVTGDLTGHGTVNVSGAAVVAGNVNISGNFDVSYNSSTLSGLSRVSTPGLSGGSLKDWKDW